jgi:hypothetical protein
MIEVVSPGNKDTKHAVASFVAKAVDFIRNRIHFVAVDLVPPGHRPSRWNSRRPGPADRHRRGDGARSDAGAAAAFASVGRFGSS